VRVATWNLQRARGAKARLQEEVLADVKADVIVLTEPASPSLLGVGAARSPVERVGPSGKEAWIAIVGRDVERIEPTYPFERLAVAATVRDDGIPIVLYGSVLPWLAAPHHAPEVARPGETSLAMFQRLLNEQVDDIRRLQVRFPEAPVLWIGDFNQTLDGPNRGGSEARRTLLAHALESLEMRAWNRTCRHAQPAMCAVDLICGPLTRPPAGKVGYISPIHLRRRVSDHAGYFLDL
jgi:endonuclease/exonuclease/phosphatase family metal-dependent hydrolase